jgi:hypothetical protein
VPAAVDPSAADLIRAMLARSPAERIPIAEIQRHPWVTGRASGSDKRAPVEIGAEAQQVSQRVGWHASPQQNLSGNGAPERVRI